MKIVTHIPEEIAEQFRKNPQIGVRTLRDETKLTNYGARIYHYIFNHGRIVAHYESKLKPKNGKSLKALLLADLHIPYQDDLAIALALDHGLSQNPDIVVVPGDAFDCYAISQFKKDPARAHFGTEVEISKEIFRTLDEKISSCASVKEKIFIKGNHEGRLEHELWGDSKKLAGLKILTIPIIYELKDMGWEYVDNESLLLNDCQVFKLGKLPIIHGHEVRLRGGQLINVARWYYLKCKQSVMVFHWHVVQEYITKKLDLTHEGAFVSGCLCLTQDYAPFNEWVQGFTIVDFTEHDFSVRNLKIINGKVL